MEIELTKYFEIPRYPGYACDSDGNVYTRWRRRYKVGETGSKSYIGGEYRKMNLTPDHDGYLHVQLRDADGVSRTLHVYRIILRTLIGPRPSGMECRHLNGDPGCNRLGNLLWGTKLENAEDRERHGTVVRGERSRAAKLDRMKIVICLSLARAELPQRKIAECFGVSQSTISEAIRGKSWRKRDGQGQEGSDQ
jgi:hypothetical protein